MTPLSLARHAGVPQPQGIFAFPNGGRFGGGTCDGAARRRRCRRCAITMPLVTPMARASKTHARTQVSIAPAVLIIAPIATYRSPQARTRLSASPGHAGQGRTSLTARTNGYFRHLPHAEVPRLAEHGSASGAVKVASDSL